MLKKVVFINLKRSSAVARLCKGDIILASPKTRKLSLIVFMYQLFLKSQYTHSMLYIGNGKIIHTASKKGVIISKVMDFIPTTNKSTSRRF